MGQQRRPCIDSHLRLSRQQRLQHLCRRLVRNREKFPASTLAQPALIKIAGGVQAEVSPVDRIRFGLRHVHQLVHVVGRHRRVGHQDAVEESAEYNARHILDRIVGQLRAYHRVERHHAVARRADRVAIGHCANAGLRADDAVTANAVLHDDGLPQRPAQWLDQGARQRVAGRAGNRRHDDANGLRWKSLRLCCLKTADCADRQRQFLNRTNRLFHWPHRPTSPWPAHPA